MSFATHLLVWKEHSVMRGMGDALGFEDTGKIVVEICYEGWAARPLGGKWGTYGRSLL